jgi:hypothetical protein
LASPKQPYYVLDENEVESYYAKDDYGRIVGFINSQWFNLQTMYNDRKLWARLFRHSPSFQREMIAALFKRVRDINVYDEDGISPMGYALAGINAVGIELIASHPSYDKTFSFVKDKENADVIAELPINALTIDFVTAMSRYLSINDIHKLFAKLCKENSKLKIVKEMFYHLPPDDQRELFNIAFSSEDDAAAAQQLLEISPLEKQFRIFEKCFKEIVEAYELDTAQKRTIILNTIKHKMHDDDKLFARCLKFENQHDIKDARPIDSSGWSSNNPVITTHFVRFNKYGGGPYKFSLNIPREIFDVLNEVRTWNAKRTPIIVKGV